MFFFKETIGICFSNIATILLFSFFSVFIYHKESDGGNVLWMNPEFIS